MDDIRTNVEIADRTGHSSLSLTKQETLDLIEMNQDLGFTKTIRWYKLRILLVLIGLMSEQFE